MAKISTFMIGIVLVGLAIYGTSNFISEGASNYGVTYDNTTYASLNKLSELNSVANDTKQDLDDLAATQGVLDVIGDFVTKGYTTVKTLALSFDSFFELSAAATGFLGLDETYNNALGTIVIILLFVAVILSAIIKWRL